MVKSTPHRLNDGVGIDRDVDPVSVVARVDVRQQLFTTILDPFDRPSELSSERDRDELIGINLGLRTKSPTDTG